MNLNSYYQNLKITDPQSEFRARVINECGISEKTFYNWINSPERIPLLAKEKIASIASEEKEVLFPETIPSL